MSFGVTRYLDTGNSDSGSSNTKLELLKGFRENGGMEIMTQDKPVLVNASIYEEVKVFMDGTPLLPIVVLSNGLALTQDDLSRITIAWENLINPNTLKGFFLSLPPMDVEKMFDAIQEVEECNDDFDGCAVKLSALGCPNSIMDTCIQALILAKPVGYKIKKKTAGDIAEDFSETDGN